MSNYRPPPYGSNQSYPNYPGQPNPAGYPQYPQQPQQAQPQYPGYPQQPQHPPFYPQQQQPPYGQHGQYTPAGVRGIEYPNFSAPPAPHVPPHVKPYSAPGVPQDPSAPAPPPPPGAPPPAPPQGAPAQHQGYWGQQQMAQPRPLNEVEARAAAATIFDRFDVDNGGYLDLQEFMDALRALHLAITYQEAMECFIRSDANEDGRIGKEEFVNIYVEEMKKPRF